ncbi:MAG: hypothetical protein ABSA47_13090 [Verrucomicrobiota bacterium]
MTTDFTDFTDGNPRLRRDLPGHEVQTVPRAGWGGVCLLTAVLNVAAGVMAFPPRAAPLAARV